MKKAKKGSIIKTMETQETTRITIFLLELVKKGIITKMQYEEAIRYISLELIKNNKIIIEPIQNQNGK